MRKLCFAVLVASSAVIAAPANAVTTVTSGSVSSAHLFSPAVNLSTTPVTYSVFNGGTFQVTGSGDLSAASGRTGTLNGSINFSKTVGTVLAQTLTDLFVFSDGNGGTYNFSGTTVQTVTFSDTPGITTSGSFKVFGSLIDTNLGVGATASTLTISFNSTGSSAYSSSATMSIGGVAPAVPEPATWAMMLVGFGMIGAASRYRRRSTAATFA
ncbi:hypothetical protein GGQ80_003213 [Sphingomonas jinjuensis]|uniref:Ice-binding protein C-terminal domain-containing protein n=1 Tax=Sphingomonas jinjuensis TaxID=535907 RepID=A0A840F7R6_9SPHN|nr:PEPxxWA-CTERM sorting domain-containing protein [Sphingomonas jinjuensis]MBB4155293.1 hypothetical protein [Sphingomonas jinjuensis]